MSAEGFSIRPAEALDAERMVEVSIAARGGAGSEPGGRYLGGVNGHPDFQRRGIGSTLTRARLGWIWDRVPEAWFVTNARSSASIELHERLGSTEIARAGEFHGTTFDGGVGILFRVPVPRGQEVSPGAGSDSIF